MLISRYKLILAVAGTIADIIIGWLSIVATGPICLTNITKIIVV